ncbi:glycosyltransferase [Nguyenibacter sp. L1]|uniref:glycosyltransferase n=1 Tax=Nguyenibacter sp. L1 TaxID=3049350 RepID=UPI002B498296|nr:glycosyltransferase [Nguyenibacter sp. L1]WRH88847.1 glycosyltransferase [Nguyenibacter sp. L1]
MVRILRAGGDMLGAKPTARTERIAASFRHRLLQRARHLAERIPASLPAPGRALARHGLRFAYWVATPRLTGARLAAMRRRLDEVLADRAVRRIAPLRHLARHPASCHPAQGGHYVLQAAPAGYVYVPHDWPPDFAERLAALAGISFSIVAPAGWAAPEATARMIASVTAQWFPHWTLILAGPAETMPPTAHPQITILHVPAGHRIAAINAAIRRAEGDFVVLLDPDQELTPDCLYAFATRIAAGDAEFLYADEDRIDPDGGYTQPFFKPDWSPDTLLSLPYTGRVSCIRRSLLHRIGPLREEHEGAEHWDLALRVTEQTRHIGHVSQILFHDRHPPDRPPCRNAGRKTRQDAFRRRGLAAMLEPIAQAPCHDRVRYAVRGTPLISIVIPTRDNGPVLARCIASLAPASWRHVEIVILDNGSADPETLRILSDLDERTDIRVIRHDAPFNFSELNNIGARQARGDILLFLNDDTELHTADALDRMAGYAQLPHIGAVGAKLLYPALMQVQHVGVVNLDDGPGHAFLRHAADDPGYVLRNIADYNWSAVTGACLMIERPKFDAVQGFDEDFPVAYNDIDLCFRLLEQGLYNVSCPAAIYLHHESLSRGQDAASAERRARLDRERHRLYRRHPGFLMHDPWYNPNLRQHGAPFAIVA